MFEIFIEKIKEELGKKLPGNMAHEKMRPYFRLSPSLNVPISPFAKASAVMCLLFEKENKVHLILIKRPDYQGVHGGQLAFPGGKPEPFDSNLLATAIRETYEEIGIEKEKISTLGQLSNVYVWASNFLVTPFIGFLESKPKYIKNTREVAEIIEIPISFLLREDIIKEKPMKSKLNNLMNAPYFDIDGKVLWGATAMMINELLEIIKRNEILNKINYR